MPRRSNLFQDVVAIVQQRLAGDASIEESALLENRVTGERREVDVVIRSVIAGQKVTVAVEATSTSRAAGSEWVERMLGKHADLPTDKLVLVSDLGFSRPARQLAESKGAVPISPEVLAGGDPEFALVNNLGSVWAKVLSLTPDEVSLLVQRPDGTEHVVKGPPVDLNVVDVENQTLADLKTFVLSAVSSSQERFVSLDAIRDQMEDVEKKFQIDVQPFEARIGDTPTELYLRWQISNGLHELHLIKAARISGVATISVNEISLTHKDFGSVSVSYGEHAIDGKPAVVIATVEQGVERIVLRLRDAPGPGESRDVVLRRLDTNDEIDVREAGGVNTQDD